MPQRRMNDADLFGAQPTGTAELPDPGILLENLTRCVIEVLAGVRELEQLSRWLHESVFRHLLRRVVVAARAREARRQAAVRPVFSIGGIHRCEPGDGVVEASVIVRGRARARAVAIRLEGIDGRWRATALHVL